MSSEAVFIKDEEALFEFLNDKLAEVFSPHDRIAVKLHMGEPGNIYFIKHSFTKRIIDILKNLGCNPYVFDTPVIYRSPRSRVNSYLKSAAEHGYTEEKIGAPVVISNRCIQVSGERMDYDIALDPIEADGIVLLTHFKGHMASGIGGAIKNIGMGCMSKETKGSIHEGGEPYYTEGCTQCLSCVESCPTENIRIDGNQPRFDCTWCPGCSNCAIICPESCISPKVALFDELIAEAAVLAHDRYKKVYAVNVLKNISRYCDCVADSGPIVLEDLGFLCASDMLTADIASLEMIKRASGREDLFFEHNKRSPWGHVRAAAEMMGRNLDVSIRETV
jgi:uncharacterized Fe-S center protein